MNKINPIYGLLLTLLFVIILIVLNIKMDKKIAKTKQDILNTQRIALELSHLKKEWGDKKGSKERIKKIIQKPFLLSKISRNEVNAKKYIIEFKKLDKRGFDWLMNNIFNSFLKVEKIQIVRLSKDSVYLYLEFKL